MNILLVVLYIIFISLGLPDSLFGVAWPVIHLDFGVAESFASLYSIIVGICTGGLSLFAGKLLRKFGTPAVTTVSILLTVVGLIGMSISPNIIIMMLFAVVLGSGAGAIDTGLNNYVSTHYKAQHMNWLHCFWGVGVTVSPLIMSIYLNDGMHSWRAGYRTVGFIQTGILVMVLAVLPLWLKLEKKYITRIEKEQFNAIDKKMFQIFAMKGVIPSVLSLSLYSAMEFIIGTWGASYLVNVFQMSPAGAAQWVSLYYGGIMIGRLISGFIALKLRDSDLIRIGIFTAAIGVGIMFIPMGRVQNIGLLLIGIGFGPVMPSVLHAIPDRFGVEYSADITGYHTFGANAIGFLLQLTFGYVATGTTFRIAPFVLLGLIVMFVLTQQLTLRILHKETFLGKCRRWYKYLKNKKKALD